MENSKNSTKMDALTKEKYEAVNKHLEEEYVLVHLAPSIAGTTLPEHLMANNSVTLKLSRLFRGGIEVQKSKIVTDLLFGDKYFSCVIPLKAVWGLTSHNGKNFIWPESTPAEVLEQLLKFPPKEEPKTPQPLEAQSISAESTQAPAKKEIRKGHLRRVK